jgi:uncharacterized protein YdhG (YjbR/CyaY superfamily)
MAEVRAAKRSAGKSDGFTAEERAAMRERAREAKAGARRSGKASREEGEREVLDKIAEMPEADRRLAERLHALVMATAPDLVPRTWYGMPAYAKDDKVICFFKNASKFKARYATVGFSDTANLDDGAMWPTDFALIELTPEVEKRIVELVERAVS